MSLPAREVGRAEGFAPGDADTVETGDKGLEESMMASVMMFLDEGSEKALAGAGKMVERTRRVGKQEMKDEGGVARGARRIVIDSFDKA